MPLKKLTTLSLFTAIALAIYGVECAIPPLIPIPGIKLGLANIVTLVVLRLYSEKDAFLVLIARVFLSTLLFGQAMSLLYSLAGGILCFLSMAAMDHLFQRHMLYLTSTIGALFHNLGQLLVALLLTAVPGVFSYLPFLTLSGIITGLFTGLCAHFSLKLLRPLIAGSPFSPKEGDDK